MSSSLPPPTSVVHDELHALADNINCSFDDDVVVGPIYELLKDGAGEQQECENSDNNNKNSSNNVVLSRRKSKYGDRIKSVDALFVDMYVLNASNGLLEYNSNWRQEWDASVTTRRPREPQGPDEVGVVESPLSQQPSLMWPLLLGVVVVTGIVPLHNTCAQAHDHNATLAYVFLKHS